MNKLAVLTFITLSVFLTACVKDMLKPEEKVYETMIEFEMPDYEATRENAVKKVEQWFKNGQSEDKDRVIYDFTNDNVVSGTGFVVSTIRKEDLNTQFELKVTVLTGNKLLFSTRDYIDLPGPLKGESDRTNVFKNRVLDRVKEMTDHLEDYLEEDTSAPKDDILDMS